MSPYTLDKLIKFISEFEGLRLKAYPDPGTGGVPWTIGIGTTVYPDGRSVRPGHTCTAAQALDWLKHEVSVRYTPAVLKLVTVPLAEHELSALVSFAYNVGNGNLAASTLLKLLNSGAPKAEVAKQFGRWTRAAGKEMPGLVKRRAAEANLFLHGFDN